MTKILRQRRIRGGYIFAAVALLLGTIVLGQAKPSLAQEPRESSQRANRPSLLRGRPQSQRLQGGVDLSWPQVHSAQSDGH